MNLPRLRELVQAGKDGALRPEEAKELFDALPEVFDLALTGLNFREALRSLQGSAPKQPMVPDVPTFDHDDYAGRFGY